MLRFNRVKKIKIKIIRISILVFIDKIKQCSKSRGCLAEHQSCGVGGWRPTHLKSEYLQFRLNLSTIGINARKCCTKASCRPKKGTLA